MDAELQRWRNSIESTHCQMDIHDVFRPFYWCGKVLGFFCFTFAPRPKCKKHARDDVTIITDVGSKASMADRQSGRLQARTSLRNCIMCLVNVAILMWSMLSVRTNSDISVILPLLGHVMDIVLWISHMSTLITYALLFAVRQRMAGIISDLCHVDSQVRFEFSIVYTFFLYVLYSQPSWNHSA